MNSFLKRFKQSLNSWRSLFTEKTRGAEPRPDDSKARDASALTERAGNVLDVLLIPIANQVILPGAVHTLKTSNPEWSAMIRHYSDMKKCVAISLAKQSDPKAEFASSIAVLSDIIDITHPQTNQRELAAQGRHRAKILSFKQTNPFFVAEVELLEDTWEGQNLSRENAHVRLLALLDRWAFLKGNMDPSILDPMRELSPERLCDLFGFYALQDIQQKKTVLEHLDGEQRFVALEGFMQIEIRRLENCPLIHHLPNENSLIH